jgi:molecular chaperone DnaK
MVQESKSHAADDRKRRELADARNEGDSLAYQAEKALQDLGEKVPAKDREQIEEKITELREVMQGEDLSEIKRLTEEVNQASHALSQQMYAQEAEPQTEETDSQGSADDEEVVEGEFREA